MSHRDREGQFVSHQPLILCKFNHKKCIYFHFSPLNSYFYPSEKNKCSTVFALILIFTPTKRNYATKLNYWMCPSFCMCLHQVGTVNHPINQINSQ